MKICLETFLLVSTLGLMIKVSENSTIFMLRRIIYPKKQSAMLLEIIQNYIFDHFKLMFHLINLIFEKLSDLIISLGQMFRCAYTFLH